MVLLLLSLIAFQPALANDVRDASEDARRLGAILDYVAADYGGAVADGQVSSDNEYAEQVGFLKDAKELAQQLPPTSVDVSAGIDDLVDSVDALAPASQVTAAALLLRHDVLEAYDVELTPTAAVSRQVGARLYAEHCADCHGLDGGADTPLAATLTPAPRNFRDPAVMDTLTPARSYNGITDGVKDTAMPSFGTLSASDRWNLAFYIFTLRHDGSAEARGQALADAELLPPRSMSELSADSDASLSAGLQDAQALDAIAWYRGVASFRSGGASLAGARAGLDAAIVALEAGDRAEARRLTGEAYLGGFEPHEVTLRQASPDLVVRIEDSFLSIRSQIGAGESVADLRAEVLRTQALLDDAQAILAGAHGKSVAFVGALVVVLREGLEAALLLLLLLGYAGKAGSSGRRQVHAGWLVAVLAGIATWFASGSLVALAGSKRELVEGTVTLLAAGVMVTAHHWLRSAANGKRRVKGIQGVLGREVGRWTLFALAFGAVYREAFEVVLFLQAIALDGATGTQPVLAGVGVGAALLVGLVAVLLRVGHRMRTGPVLTAAGVLLAAMAVVFVGKGIRSFQEAGIVSIHAFGVLRVDVLGIFPTIETGLAQALLLLVLLVPLIHTLRSGVPGADPAHGA
ncbi:MAG: c-type cytochrome [Oligoflexia bacterium]|nr:c-type cytochrome [Oligoflexia bacterium]